MMFGGDGDDEKLMLSIQLRMKRKQKMVKMVKMVKMMQMLRWNHGGALSSRWLSRGAGKKKMAGDEHLLLRLHLHYKHFV